MVLKSWIGRHSAQWSRKGQQIKEKSWWRKGTGAMSPAVDAAKEYAAGFTAGVATVITGHPFDTIKVGPFAAPSLCILFLKFFFRVSPPILLLFPLSIGSMRCWWFLQGAVYLILDVCTINREPFKLFDFAWRFELREWFEQAPRLGVGGMRTVD